MARGCNDADAELIIQLMCSREVLSCSAACDRLGVDKFAAYNKLGSDKYTARYQIAKQIIADVHNDNARQHLADIDDADTQAAVTRKRELAQFDMRMAGVINRDKFGKVATISHQTVNNTALLDAADQLRLINEQRAAIYIAGEDGAGDSGLPADDVGDDV